MTPSASRCWAMPSAGEPRTSSVFGLKASPNIATIGPGMVRTASSRSLAACSRCSSLVSYTACKIGVRQPLLLATAARASTSFGKHDPPQPRPALRKAGPMRLSMPTIRATSSTLASTAAAMCEISFMNETRAASRAFAVYLASSAERVSTATIGASIDE